MSCPFCTTKCKDHRITSPTIAVEFHSPAARLLLRVELCRVSFFFRDGLQTTPQGAFDKKIKLQFPLNTIGPSSSRKIACTKERGPLVARRHVVISALSFSLPSSEDGKNALADDGWLCARKPRTAIPAKMGNDPGPAAEVYRTTVRGWDFWERTHHYSSESWPSKHGKK